MCVVLVVTFQEWGQPGDLKNLSIRWHTPTADEKSFATELLREFLMSEFHAIEQHVSGEKTLTRSVKHAIRMVSRWSWVTNMLIVHCVFRTVDSCSYLAGHNIG